MSAILFTGNPGAGKTTAAKLVRTRLESRGVRAAVLDGDALRQGKDFGFSEAGRLAAAMHAAQKTVALARRGIFPLVALVMPTRSIRAKFRSVVGDLAIVHCTADEKDLRARRTELYTKADAGLTEWVDYEVPDDACVRVNSSKANPLEISLYILNRLEGKAQGVGDVVEESIIAAVGSKLSNCGCNGRRLWANSAFRVDGRLAGLS